MWVFIVIGDMWLYMFWVWLEVLGMLCIKLYYVMFFMYYYVFIKLYVCIVGIVYDYRLRKIIDFNLEWYVCKINFKGKIVKIFEVIYKYNERMGWVDLRI